MLLWLKVLVPVLLMTNGGAQAPLNSTCDDCSREPLRLLTMLPYRNPLPVYNPSWDQGLDIVPALNLAAEQINNRTDILPCRKLELIHVDCGCDIIPTTSLGILNGLYNMNRAEVVGVVGPGCSVSSIAMASATNRPEIQLVILHDAGSPLLADRVQYHNSLGILGSTRAFVDLSFGLMNKTKWRNIAILYESTRMYYRSATENFVNRTKTELPEVRILFKAAVFKHFYPLDEIKESLARIVFLYTSPEHSRRIMCLAKHKGLVYHGYQWIMASRRLDDFKVDVDFYYHGRTYKCTSEDLLTIALDHVFIMSYQLSAESSNDVKPLAKTTFSEFVQLYEERIESYNTNSENPNNHTIASTYWAYNMYDAIWAWAVVLDNLLRRHGNISFTYGNETLANMIVEEFYSLNEFQGMSGNISFNVTDGFIHRKTNLYQIVDGKETYVGSNYGADNTEIQEDSYVAIPDIVMVVDLPHRGLVGFFITFQSVEFVIVVMLHVLTILYRKSKSVKASSPRLTHFVFVGLYVLIVATMVLSASEINDYSTTTNGILCQLLWAWLLPIGFTLVVGTVAVRTWRLYRIFAHYMHPGRFISTTALLTIIHILLFFDITIAIIWTSVDSMQRQLRPFTVENGSVNVQMLYRICISDTSKGWLWILLVHGYKIALLLFVIMLTVLTRSIPNRSFATTSLGVFSYTFSAVYLVGFPTFYLLDVFNHDPNADYSTLSITLNTMLCLIVACIVAPPLLPVAKAKLERYFDKDFTGFCNHQVVPVSSLHTPTVKHKIGD